MPNIQSLHASVHRFHDCVACDVGDGSTVYLTPEQARKLATALNRVARSVESEAFQLSRCGRFELPVGTTGYNGTEYVHARGTK